MVTQDQVNEICASLQARGERPTVDRVRAELGGGSPNALTPLVRIWRESQGQKGLEAPPPAAPIEPGTLPTAIQRAIDALTVAVTNLGPAFSQAVADVAETERRRSRLEVESAAAGARAQVAEARLAAEDERAATNSVRAEVLELEAAIGAKDAEARQLADALAARDQVLAERAAEVERLAGRIEQERAARAEADTRLAELQDQVQTSRSAAAAAQAIAAAADAEAQRQRDLVTATAARLDAALATIAELRTEAAVARQAVDGERQRAERAELERTTAELAAREAIGKAAKMEGEIATLRGDHAAPKKPRRDAGAD